MKLRRLSQIRTAMDIYSHVMPALAREAADRMGALLLPGKGQANWNHKCSLRRLRPPSRLENGLDPWVELRGLEPLTPTLPGRLVGVQGSSLRYVPQVRTPTSHPGTATNHPA
jgi:hypothetical protein